MPVSSMNQSWARSLQPILDLDYIEIPENSTHGRPGGSIVLRLLRILYFRNGRVPTTRLGKELPCMT